MGPGDAGAAQCLQQHPSTVFGAQRVTQFCTHRRRHFCIFSARPEARWARTLHRRSRLRVTRWEAIARALLATRPLCRCGQLQLPFLQAVRNLPRAPNWPGNPAREAGRRCPQEPRGLQYPGRSSRWLGDAGTEERSLSGKLLNANLISATPDEDFC